MKDDTVYLGHIQECMSMTNNKLNRIDVGILNRLAEYCKYLYEEEKQRTERIERKVNLFAIALGGSVVGVLLKLPVERTSLVADMDWPLRFLTVVLFALLIILLFLSSLFTFLVYRVRKFEGLSDPKQTALKTTSIASESEFLATLIADFTVATNRNHQINERKARHLSYALLTLLGAFVVFIAGLLVFSASVWKSGGN